MTNQEPNALTVVDAEEIARLRHKMMTTRGNRERSELANKLREIIDIRNEWLKNSRRDDRKEQNRLNSKVWYFKNKKVKDK